ncbi:MAG: hypothetical protein GXZ11_00990 [Tissierellia bacterium]|nr:hypothetical protein [Tissierellia bacterium]
MKYDERISKLKDEIDKARDLKIRSEAKLEQLNIQREQILSELRNLNIQPEDLEDEICKLENEIEQLLFKAESLLPKKH